jgi:hypothetical protein
MDRRLTRIYLNDHVALMALLIDVAERSAKSNRDSPLGARLLELRRELAAQRETLERVMERLRVRRSGAKVALAHLGQRVGQLKLNGRLTSYSPLSRLFELESLLAGLEANRAVMESLRLLDDPRLDGFDFGALARVAGEQHDELERFRREAVATALSRSAS